jgi:hypothetical protein
MGQAPVYEKKRANVVRFFSYHTIFQVGKIYTLKFELLYFYRGYSPSLIGAK